MSLLFNMLSRLVITFLPRSKRLLISWLQSPSTGILEPVGITNVRINCCSYTGVYLVVLLFFLLFFFLPHGVACGILFPQPGIESETPALGLNHYTVREVLNCIFMESLDL